MAGRNDPCPCGSGKKYKKCCVGKEEDNSRLKAALESLNRTLDARLATSSAPQASTVAGATHAPRPPVPVPEEPDSRWKEFKSSSGAARVTVFLNCLDDAGFMDDEMAFEMLNQLHSDLAESGDRARFGECVDALRERQPAVYDQGAHYYLSWRLLDALAEERYELASALAREFAARGARDIDTFNLSLTALGYHGQLSALVEALRIAWPEVKTSEDIISWGISNFAERGVRHECFDYLEHTDAPNPHDPALLERVRFFIENPRAEFLPGYIADITGTSERDWQSSDFDLPPRQERKRDEWGDDDDDDDDDEREEGANEAAANLSHLISEFVGYLRRVENVAYPRAYLVAHELVRYFLDRNEGHLDPRPSMADMVLHPDRKPPKPPKPAHPLCPERVTLEVFLAQLMGMMSGDYHSAAALFQAMPAWLRFLESRRLIDSPTHKKVLTGLRPLHASLLKAWKTYTDDPTLYRQGETSMDEPKKRPSTSTEPKAGG